MSRLGSMTRRITVSMLIMIGKTFPIKLTQSFLLPLMYTPLRKIVFGFWVRVLTLGHYRRELVRWNKACWDITKDPGIGLVYIDRAMETGDLVDDDVIEWLEERIFYRGTKLIIQREHLNRVLVLHEIEQAGTLGFHEHSISESPVARQYFYKRMNIAHVTRNAIKVDLYARCYLAAEKYDSGKVLSVSQNLLFTNGLHQTAIDVIAITLMRLEDEDEEKLEDLQSEKIAHMLELGISVDDVEDKDEDADVDHVEDDEEGESEKIAHTLELGISVDDVEDKDEDANVDDMQQRILNALKLNTLGELAQSLEEDGEYVGALALYRAVYNFGSSQNVSDISAWLYVHALLTLGKGNEAVAVMRDTQESMWKFFDAYSRQSYQSRQKKDFALPKQGGLILGCWGLGDEFLRMAIWHQLADLNGKWALTCDPRMQAVFQRSFPEMEVIANSRTNGPFAVEETQYWEDREGISDATDLARITRHVVKRSKAYKDIILSEDLFYAFIKKRGDFKRRTDAPLLQADAKRKEEARAWLATLPPGLNIAISWRSGSRNLVRDRSYTDIMEWEDVLRTPGINFINMQYSDTSEEEEDVSEHFGVKLHSMPGVDRKDDIEGLLGLCCEVDLVIAPCTTVREMAASVGAPVWSLTVTPALPDLWRIEAGKNTDIFFPTMRHFTYEEYGSKRGVLDAMAQNLLEMQKA